jgi:hypothetical protein
VSYGVGLSANLCECVRSCAGWVGGGTEAWQIMVWRRVPEAFAVVAVILFVKHCASQGEMPYRSQHAASCRGAAAVYKVPGTVSFSEVVL